MGIVNTEITLKNLYDKLMAKDGRIKEDEIRTKTVTAMVDTGAWTLVINEAIRKELGLEITGSEMGSLADGTESSYNMAGPIEVLWNEYKVTLDALVIPNADEVLLGAIPLEAMDLVVDPRNLKLIRLPPERTRHKL